MRDRAGGTTTGRGFAVSRLRRTAWVAAAATSLICAMAAGGVLASSGGGVLPGQIASPDNALQLPPGSTRLIALTVSAAPSSALTPSPTGPPVVGPNAKAILDSVRAQLQGVTTDKGTAGHISNAIKDLDQARSTNNWVGVDGNHVADKAGPQVFDRVRDAIGELEAIKKPPPPGIGDDIGSLDYAARLIASTLLADNSCSPQKPGEVSAAQKELSNGDSEFDKTHFHEAVDHYKAAWNHAGNAKGVSCAVPGISASPAVLFSVTNLVPKDQTTKSATVQVTGTAGSVTLSQTDLQSTLGLGDHLLLTIVDTTTGRTLYPPPSVSGPLNSVPPTPVCGVGTGCPPWAVGETHNIDFTVVFPENGPADNAYQGGTAGSTFVWSRT